MDQSNITKYHILFERMVRCMTDSEHFDREKFVRVLKDMSVLFRLSKGVTEYYRTERAEKDGEGEIMIDHDIGKKDHPVLRRRILSKSKSVIICTLYMADDEKPLEEEEREKLDLILCVLINFIARNRFEASLEKLGFYDDSGYPNIRFYMRYIESLIVKNALPEYTAACFNLRHFSAVNQVYGRKAGDTALRNYFEALSASIGDDGLICRMGGDNYVMIFKKTLTKKVLDILSGIPVICDPTIRKRVLISASTGVYSIPADISALRCEEIINRIYTAMLTAKQTPESPVIYYDEKMLNERGKEAQIHLLFPRALENNEFKVFYQSKEDIETGRMYGHVIAMAHDIGLECISEGVETSNQIEILRKNHCRFAQGYFYDKPLSVEQFEERLSYGGYSILN